MDTICYLDTVELRQDVPRFGLRAGERGAVVEVLAPDVFLVEFADEFGRTTVMEEFSASQLRVVQTFEEAASLAEHRASSRRLNAFDPAGVPRPRWIGFREFSL